MSSPLPGGWTSRPRERRAFGGWIGVAFDSTRRQPSASTISGARSSPRSVWTVLPAAAGDRRGLELELRSSGLLPQQRAQLAVVERRERPRQRASGRCARACGRPARRSSGAARRQLERRQPRGRDPAGRGLALADLVAVDHQHAGAGARELARDGEPGEARAADEHVAVALQAGALRAPLRRSNRHLPGNDTAALRFARCKQ